MKLAATQHSPVAQPVSQSTSTTPGPVPVPVPVPSTLARLEQRIAAAQLALRQGLRGGTLTREEATHLQTELSRLQRSVEHSAFDADGFTPADSAKFNREVNGLGQRIRSESHDAQSNPVKRLDEAERRIAAGLADGSLTAKEADALTKSLGTLRQNLDGARWGGLSPAERAALDKRVNQLDASIHRQRSDGQVNVTKRVANFEARINAGEKDGSLTGAEAQKLRGRLAALKAGGDPANRQELAKSLDALSRGIFHQRHDVQVDTGARTKFIEKQLDAAVNKGSLSPAQADALRAELKHAVEHFSPADLGARLNALSEKIAMRSSSRPVVVPMATM